MERDLCTGYIKGEYNFEPNPEQRNMNLTILIMTLLFFDASNEILVFKQVGGSTPNKENREMMVQVLKTKSNGVPVSNDTLKIWIQHRSKVDFIHSSHKKADVVIACFPSRIPQSNARKKAVFSSYSGRVYIKVVVWKGETYLIVMKEKHLNNG